MSINIKEKVKNARNVRESEPWGYWHIQLLAKNLKRI